MGFSTNITIQNDFWHEIAKKPEKLIDAISIGMNEGVGGSAPLAEALDHKYGRDSWERRYQVAPQGVTVHRAQHNDVPQVIVSTYGSHALAAHELPYAIDQGWLDLGDYNLQHADVVAGELESLARDIRDAVKRAQKRT
jgi:hypothetical protein